MTGRAQRAATQQHKRITVPIDKKVFLHVIMNHGNIQLYNK